MSVIMGALKAAQREKARRESQAAGADAASLLIPLRSKPHRSSGARMLALLGVGATAIAAAVVAAVLLNRKPALPAVPPITSAILAEALAADSANRVTQTGVAPAPVAAARDSAARTIAQTAGTPRRVTVRTAETPAVSADTGSAVPQGAARATASADSVAAPAGRLRVAVDRPGQRVTATLFAEAVAAHRNGDVQTARRLYDSVLVFTPRDADALNNLGVLLSAQREFAGAHEFLKRAAAAAPRNAGVWNNIGTVYREQGRHEDAIAAFRHALSLDADHAGAKVGLAQEYLAISSLAQARALLEEAIAVHPSLPEARYTLGQVLELQGERAGAIAAYEAFVRLAPPRLSAHTDLVKRRIEAIR